MAFQRETVFTSAPGKGKCLRVRRGSKRTYTGIRPYYRRTMEDGSVAIYLRDSTSRVVGKVVGDPSISAMFERGRSYTIEETII